MNITFNLHAPQIIWFILNGLLSLTATIAHGKTSPTTSKLSPIGYFMSSLLGIGLLFWGGVFKSFGFPQTIIVVYFVLSFFEYFSSKEKIVTTNFFRLLSNQVIYFGVLYWAGFFT
jgi:hypothetical protein